MSFFKRNLQIFQRIGLPLYVLSLIYTSLDQLLTINMDAALRSTNGAIGLVWFYGFFSLVFGIVFPILGVLIVLYGAKTPAADEHGLWLFIHQHLQQMSIEILRSWGKTLLWSLLFILPGIWKFVEYTMIPFVVSLSQRYERGEEDALQASSLLVRHHLLKVCAILFVFHLLLPGMLTVFFDEYRLVWQTPVAALALTVVDVYLFIASTQMLLTVFENETQESPHAESHV